VCRSGIRAARSAHVRIELATSPSVSVLKSKLCGLTNDEEPVIGNQVTADGAADDCLIDGILQSKLTAPSKQCVVSCIGNRCEADRGNRQRPQRSCSETAERN
jgi:hypothetical protein